MHNENGSRDDEQIKGNTRGLKGQSTGRTIRVEICALCEALGHSNQHEPKQEKKCWICCFLCGSQPARANKESCVSNCRTAGHACCSPFVCRIEHSTLIEGSRRPEGIPRWRFFQTGINLGTILITTVVSTYTSCLTEAMISRWVVFPRWKSEEDMLI